MKKLLLFVSAVLFLASCKKDMSSSSDKDYASIVSKAFISASNKGDDALTVFKQNNDKQVSKPFKASGSGTISYTPNSCGAGTLRFRSDGSGNATHLGLLNQVTTFCIDGATGAPMSAIVGVGTAANGDKLYYTFVGTGVNAAGLTYQDYVFTGGTGKFESATGNMTLVYNVFTPTNYSYTGEGNIAY